MSYKIKLKIFFQLQNLLSLTFLTMISTGFSSQDINLKRTESGDSLVGGNNKESHNIITPKERPNFLLVDYLPDGEMERRISLNGITAKETSVGNTTKSVRLWQISNGKTFFQMIFSSDNELIDCEYVKQRNLVSDFLDKFYTEIEAARSRNFTSPYIFNANRRSHTSNREFRQFVDNDILTPEMEEYNENLQDFTTISTTDAFGMRNLTYTTIKNESGLPDELRQWMNYNQLKMQCDKRHREMKEIVRGLNSKHEHEKIEAQKNLDRKKRDLSDIFQVPYTKWCGRGHKAGKYTHLGGATRADKCCRKHDHCKLFINGMESSWGLFNYRPYTISHCNCDIRFRTCLKIADCADANLVGRIFFNIVQSKCFLLKREKYCKKHVWWRGECEKIGYKKRAHIRNNRSY